MNPFKAVLERHALATYFILAFGISWSGVFIVIGGPAGVPGTKEETDRLFSFVYLAMLTGPSLAGILMTLLAQGRTGLRELQSRLLRWRVGWRTFAFSLLAAPLLTAVVLLALSLVSPDFIPTIFATPDKLPVLLFGLSVGLGAGIFEELGWTGFATPELKKRHGVLAGGLFLGMLWGAWHVLVNLWASGTPTRAISPTFMLPVLLSTVGLGMLPAYRVLMVWVHEQTRSLLVGMLMHASLTASLIILRPAATGMALVVYELAWAGTLWAIMVFFGQGRARYGLEPDPPRGLDREDVLGRTLE